MAGVDFTDIELRKLPLSCRIKLGQILEVNNSWKKLMATIPSEVNPSILKYTNGHIDLIEHHGQKSGKLCGEILIDEWSTSGKVRPKIETLYEILQKCQLYRAADYIATEILNIPIPERPTNGPARKIDTREIENDGVHSISLSDYENNNDNGNHTSPNTDPSSIISPTVQIVEDTNTKEPLKNMNIILQRIKNFSNNPNQGILTNISIEIIEKLTKNFNAKYELGAGAFSKVYKIEFPFNSSSTSTSTSTNNNEIQKKYELAAKLLNPTGTIIEQQFITEINVLSMYRHENLVSLFGYSSNSIQHCLIYEFVPRGSLLETLKIDDLVLTWANRISILHGIANGLNYLHTALDKPLIHRDIKSGNILLTNELIAKIGDFGLAKQNNSNQTSALTSTIFGSSAYMSPEAFRGDISTKMDIFSLGVIILEVLTSLPPYDEERDGNDIVTYLEENVLDDNIIPFIDSKKAGPVQESTASKIYSIAQKCLEEKKKRPNSTALLQEFQNLIINFNDCDIEGKIFNV